MASKAIGFLNFKFGADLSGFERAMNKAQKKLKKFGTQLQKTGKNMTMGLTLPIVGLGVASIKTFADFEQGMLKVKAISGATNSEFKALTESAKELGSTTMFTASQVAELQLNLSKLGFDPQSILDSSQAILNLAQATDSDLGEAATVAASTMNAFGLEAKDMTMISDVMADSFSSSALDLQKFQTAMASVAPVANQAGADIQRTSAILGVLVNNGIEASSAGTALRNVFLELADQGLTWDEAMVKIQTSMNPLQTAMDLFGKRGAAVATIISNNGTEIQNLTADFNDSAGEAQKMADIMDSGVGGAMRKLQSQTEGLLIQLGTALMPIFQKVIDKLSALVKWFSGLSEEQKDNIVKWGLILAAIGPVLIIIGKMSVGIGALIGAFKGLAKFLVANPYIVFAAVITGVVFALGNWIEKAWGVSDAQRSINEVMDAANKAILTQQTEVNILTGVLKNENSTLKDKEIALNKLKEIAPDYYGKLNAAKLDVIALDTATKNYTESIQKQALAEAGRAKLVDLSKELIDLQSKQKEVNKFTETLSKLGTEEYNLGILNLASEKSSESRISSLKQEIDQITNLVVANEQLSNSQKKVDDGSGIFGLLDRVKKQYGIPTTTPTPTTTTPTTTTTTGGVEKKVEQMEALSLATHETFEEINLLSHRLDDLAMPENLFNTDPMDKYRGSLGMLGDQIATFIGTDIKSMEEAMATYAEQLGNNLAQGAESFKEYGNTVKGIMKEVIGSMISAGVAAAVKTALESIPPFPGSVFLIPALAGAAAGLARTAFNSLIPSFEDGGIISGPTVGLMGEYPGASSNPEVVAPLDKLKSMMGGGNQNIVVEGVLRGNDIYLSNKNTSVNRLRTT